MNRFAVSRQRRARSQSALYLGFITLAILLISVLPASAQNGYPARTDPYINDYAQVISAEDSGNIRQVLSDLKSSKGVELIVVTINSLDDYNTGDTTIESFATHLFNTWGIGDARRNDGILLLVAIKDRKLRIELGRGYGSGHSPEMQNIIDNTIVPDFKQNTYSRGIYRGIKAIADQVAGHLQSSIDSDPAAPQSNPIFHSTSLVTSSNSATPFGLVIGVILAGMLTVSGGLWLERRTPPRCSTCGIRTVLASQDSRCSVLNEGQQQELALGSRVHVVWKCPTCNAYHVKSYWRISRFRRCPECGYITVTHQETLAEKPTTTQFGRKFVVEDCAHCQYHHSENIVLPMLTAHDGGGYTGSSGGGGGSSGGGASGSW